MASSYTLLVWDIDGTLVGSGPGHEALDAAVARWTGVAGTGSQVRMSGRADPDILTEMLQKAGHPAPDRLQLHRIRRLYVEVLRQLLRHRPGRVLPGVRELLREAARHPRVRMVLGTGNFPEGAWAKLRAHGLHGYFATGGFGDDGHERRHILAAALRRARTAFGAFPTRVWVIGDSERDVAGGQALGVHTLAVATGRYSLTDLERLRPTLAVATLADPRVVQSLLA